MAIDQMTCNFGSRSTFAQGNGVLQASLPALAMSLARFKGLPELHARAQHLQSVVLLEFGGG